MDKKTIQQVDKMSIQIDKTSHSRTEQIYKQIKSDILSCELKPNQKLYIKELKEKYYAGGSPIREALSRLISLGLVCNTAQKGFSVSPLSISDFRDLIDTRIKIEILALDTAIANGDDCWEANIVGAFYKLTKLEKELDEKIAPDYKEWEKRNQEFHQSLLASCRSKYLLSIQDSLSEQTMRYRHYWVREADKISIQQFKTNNEEHKLLMEYAIARKKDKCIDMLRSHLSKPLKLLEKSAPQDDHYQQYNNVLDFAHSHD